MLIKRATDIPSSEITDEKVYRNRREFMKAMSATLGASAIGLGLPACVSATEPPPQAAAKRSKYDTDEKQTPFADVTTYNNYYEFGTGKDEPAMNAQSFKTKPWTVKVEGLCAKPGTYNLEDLLKGITMEDRVYRMRCVEAWSMVIPWHGFPLSTLIKRFEPTASATHIEMKTLYAPDQMPLARRGGLHWPYTEGLRMDEALNELTLLAVGVYGKPGPNQNGAPLRLVTPWKYGFKGVKAISMIRFVDKQPVSAWMEAASNEYGFYANVNPLVNHPRWSQATERRLGGGLLDELRGANIRKTLLFNGYGEYVAQMYAGLDLKKNY